MSVEVEAVTADQREEWNRAVDRSPQTTPFHRYESLVSLAEYFDAAVHPLLGRVGQEPVGVFPVFGQQQGPFLLATSPPLSVEIHAGPALLNFEKLKQRKAEVRHREFVEGCLEWIDAEMDPDVVEIKAPDRYTDVRPFLRREFEVTPSYTYVLDLGPDEDALIEQFSSDARSNIRNTAEDAYQIREEGTDAIETIVSLVQQRFDALDEYYYLEDDLVVDLHETADAVRVRPYTCRIDGEIASGLVVLEYDDTVYRWQGGSKPDVDLPVNDLLDWRVIRDARARDVDRYDLVGAMLPRLCEYKAKFGPRPTPLYLIRKRSAPASAVERVYRQMPTSVRRVFGL